jgi:O-antigen ligase
VLLVLFQLLPMPPAIWTKIPGRVAIEQGYQALGEPLPWLPLSLTPYDTLAAAFYGLPFLAVLLSVLLVRTTNFQWVVAALVLGTFAGIALGAVQAAGGESWKLYSITNTGAVGFFANRNFFGTLLVVNIPFAVALMASGKASNAHSGAAVRVLGAAYLLVIVIGIILNQSLAAALIALPVSLASLALFRFRVGWKWSVAALVVLLAVGAALLLTSVPPGSEIEHADVVSVQTRMEIWAQTLKIIGDSFPFGTGLGSFREVYDLYEEPTLIDRWYVNNAHNDYLELVLELGLPGILLMGGFLAWWVVRAKVIWQSPHVDLIARAGTIASAAVLAHSVVDYPLRTAAIASVFAFCLGAMATFGETSDQQAHPRKRRMRHVRIA